MMRIVLRAGPGTPGLNAAHRPAPSDRAIGPSRRAGAALALLALAGSAAADPGDVLWHFEVPFPGETLHRPSVGVDGTIYWSVKSLYAISPSGQEIWSRPDADVSPVGIGADGTLYIGGKRPEPNDHEPALKAFSPAGDHLWDFTDMGLVMGFLGGPSVGPDGNIYAVAHGGPLPNPPGFGAFSLTPSGDLRWHVDGFGNLAGNPTSEIVFGNGRAYKSEDYAPMPKGELQSGLVAIELDGGVAWQYSVGVESRGPSRQPRVSPLNGNIHMMRPSSTIETFTPGGSKTWIYTGDNTPTGFGAPAVGPDGSVYVINGSLHVIALDAGGGVRWIAKNIVPYTARAPEVSPDGSLLVFGTAKCNGDACPSRVMALDTSDGSVVFDTALPNLPGGLPTVVSQPRFTDDGSVLYIGADVGAKASYLFAISAAEGGPCYPDFDQNGGLNLFDFLAYTNAFNAADPAADCDASGALNLFDFLCFTNQFNEGC